MAVRVTVFASSTPQTAPAYVEASAAFGRAIADAGIPVRTDAASTHMHHKFAIVDGATLINGSFNWTRQAVLGNQENVVIARDAKLAGVFAKEFDSMWGKFRGNEYAGRGGGGNRA